MSIPLHPPPPNMHYNWMKNKIDEIFEIGSWLSLYQKP